MKKVLKNFLNNGNYTIEDAQERIDYAVVNGKITVEEAEELLKIANKKATTKPINERMETIEKVLDSMSTNDEKLKLFLDSMTVEEKPKDKKNHILVQKYDYKTHSIVWEYVKEEDTDEVEEDVPLDYEDDTAESL